MICRIRAIGHLAAVGGGGVLDWGGQRPRTKGTLHALMQRMVLEAAEPREWEEEARSFLQDGLLSPQHGFQQQKLQLEGGWRQLLACWACLQGAWWRWWYLVGGGLGEEGGWWEKYDQQKTVRHGEKAVQDQRRLSPCGFGGSTVFSTIKEGRWL